MEYPKWVRLKDGSQIVVDNAEHEKACIDETAVVETVVVSAQGAVRKVVSVESAEETKAKKGKK